MVILDIETSGLDARKCSIISIGAIDFDNPEDEFYGECRIFLNASINPDSLKITGVTESYIKDSNKQSPEELLKKFLNWLSDKKDQTIAGQNVHWDLDFLREQCKRSGIEYHFGHRIVDLHSIAYTKLLEKGETIPLRNNRTDLDLDHILSLVGLQKRQGNHNALDDCKLTLECFKKFLIKDV